MHVTIFHSALGISDGVLAFAEHLRTAGHTVVVPDLFEGHAFTNLEEGIAHRDGLGIPELMRRTAVASRTLPDDTCFIGFSMGTGAALSLALQRPACPALVLLHAALPLAAFGANVWPASLRAMFHATEGDPWVEKSAVEELANTAAGALEVHWYPGACHLPAEPNVCEDDRRTANLIVERVVAFLGDIAGG